MARIEGSETGARRRPPSSRDVAERAGVSLSTVSLVVNEKVKGRVSAQSQAAVLKAIQELGYRPDPVARGLATGRRGTVAVIVPDLDSSFFNYVTMGIGMALGDELQMLLAFEKSDGGLESLLDRVLAIRVDGILYEGASGDRLRRRGDVHCPIVILDDPGGSWTGPTVGFDLQSGAVELADHLADLGHRRIAYLTPARDATTFRVRRSAVRDQLRVRARKGARLVVTNSNTSIDAAAAATAAAWAQWQNEGVTALICATDTQAYGALLALRQLAIPVPESISVASFDDLPFSLVTNPQLTAVALPAYDLGYQAAGLLKRVLADPSAKTQPIVLPTRLTVRESTAPIGS